MHITEIELDKIDELLSFLPIFESHEFQPVKEWNTGGVPYPTYDELVREFFMLLASKPCPGNETGSNMCHELITGSNSFENASLDQICSLLNYCFRMERFYCGFWEAMIRKGRISAILRRLEELRYE